jgi:hypothetical protein
MPHLPDLISKSLGYASPVHRLKWLAWRLHLTKHRRIFSGNVGKIAFIMGTKLQTPTAGDLMNSSTKPIISRQTCTRSASTVLIYRADHSVVMRIKGTREK